MDLKSMQGQKLFGNEFEMVILPIQNDWNSMLVINTDLITKYNSFILHGNKISNSKIRNNKTNLNKIYFTNKLFAACHMNREKYLKVFIIDQQ